MDSPLASPLIDSTPFREDDDIENSSLLLFQRVNSMKPLYRTLSIVILSVVFGVVISSSFPIWRPVGVLMLHKLWDILRFLVIITSIGLGIINSRFGRGNCTEGDAGITSSGSKDESVGSKVPFVGFFYGELQTSYSFDDKEMEVGDDGILTRSESGNDRVHHANMTTSLAMETADDDDKSNSENSIKVMNDSILSNKVSNINERKAKYDEDRPGSVGEEPAISAPTANNTGLATVVVNEEPKHRSRILGIRGNSLEFPMEQEGNMAKHGEILSAAEHRRRDERASRKAPFSAPKMADHLSRRSDESSSCKTNINAAPASTNTSKHSRSRSAYDLDELLVHERRPRSKPGTTSQLARRRNVSLSCDLDKDYTVGGVPAWLAALPSPPEPPLMDGYGSGAKRGVESNIQHEGKQDESSLRKAYSESLAPWRAATNAIPVNKEGTDKSKKHPITKENKVSLMKETSAGLLTPPSSPSTPSSFVGSPSPGELNKKVDAFIARFHERMRLQRLESLEKSRRRAH